MNVDFTKVPYVDATYNLYVDKLGKLYATMATWEWGDYPSIEFKNTLISCELLLGIQEFLEIYEGESGRHQPLFKKDDGNKPAVQYIPGKALLEIGKVFEMGAKKYGAFNYLEGADYSRLMGAALRHSYKYMSGEFRDDESGLSHLAHAAVNLLMLLEYEQRGIGRNDYDRSKQ